MRAAYLPGSRTVVLRDVDTPVPRHGEVLVEMELSRAGEAYELADSGVAGKVAITWDLQ